MIPYGFSGHALVDHLECAVIIARHDGRDVSPERVDISVYMAMYPYPGSGIGSSDATSVDARTLQRTSG
jgi:hypothetical protein